MSEIPEKSILLIDFLREGAASEQVIEFEGVRFRIHQHRIGWDLDTAEVLMREHDGKVHGIALSGIQKRAGANGVYVSHPGYQRLARAITKTPLYTADEVRSFFAEWTLQRLIREQPQLFLGKKTLFHCASYSAILPRVVEAGSEVLCADALLLTGLPIPLKSVRAVQRFVQATSWAQAALKLSRRDSDKRMFPKKVQRQLSKWVSDCDIFVTFGSLLDQMESQMGSLDALKDKIVLTDYLSPEAAKRIEAAGARQVVEFTPKHSALDTIPTRHFSLLTALLDQIRIDENSDATFNEFVLQWIQHQEVKPNRFKSTAGIERRCAFIIHALTQNDLWKAPGLGLMKSVHPKIRDLTSAGLARLPAFYYGALKGAVSKETGQQVVCDIYALPATPRQLISMDEAFVYKRLVQTAELAAKRGAAMIGLGAYTKVIGDAGLTVSKRSPIPVTNGNSYSASTTLWAAHAMVKKIGAGSGRGRTTDGRVKAKAMVIGATGSIGRVSSLLVSLVVDELVLVATRPDRLLDLKQEIEDLSPTIQVKVTTNPNPELHDTDLIVTATSNQHGSILDIMKVKPGAVICDCSRPLDIGPEEAAKRPDVLVIESGEVKLPGDVSISCDIGLPKPTVYACLAETVLLTMEGRYEGFSLSKQLSMEKVKEIYRIGNKHGAELAEIQGPNGLITDEQIQQCMTLARENLKSWKSPEQPRKRSTAKSLPRT